MSPPANHDEYIAQAAEALRPTLTALRDQLRRILPDADEVIAYGLPGFVLGGATVVGYAAFTHQCGIYLSPEAVAALSDELSTAGFRPTKTGVKFGPRTPIPADLIEKLVHASRTSLGHGPPIE